MSQPFHWQSNFQFLQNHRFSYGEPMTVVSTTQALCDLAPRFGEGDEESMVIIISFGGSYENNSLADSSLQEKFNKVGLLITYIFLMPCLYLK